MVREVGRKNIKTKHNTIIAGSRVWRSRRRGVEAGGIKK